MDFAWRTQHCCASTFTEALGPRLALLSRFLVDVGLALLAVLLHWCGLPWLEARHYGIVWGLPGILILQWLVSVLVNAPEPPTR